MSRRRDERGSVAVFVGVTSLLMVLMASFAVDLGMQRVVRRDMQALADVVALDLARELDGKKTKSDLAPAINPDVATSALSLSVARNSGTLGNKPRVTAELGGLVAGVFDPSVDPPTAVRVTAVGSVDFAFRTGSGSATRSAIGSTIKSACYSLGSFAARFRSGDSALIATLVSPMNELLRPQANLSAADYTGLATAEITLDELATEAGLGSTDQLLSGTVTARQVITAAIAAIGKQSPSNAVAVSALNQLLKGQANLDTPVLLTNVVSVSPTDTAALQTNLNVLDFVAGTILLADGTHGFQIGNGNLGTQIAGVASLTSATLTVIEKPQIACGPYGSAEAAARTSQLYGTVEAKLELPTINLGGGDIVQTSPSTVTLNVALGNATASLANEPACGEGTVAEPDEIDVTVQSGLATYQLSTTLGFETTMKVDLGLLGEVNVVISWNQTASAGQPMPDQSTLAELLIPPNDDTPYATGTGDAGLGGATVSTVATDVVAKVKSTGASVPVATVTPLLQPIVNALAVHTTVDGRLDTLAANIDTALTPLLTLLGLNVSGADVLALGRPVCGAPVLRG